MPNINKQTNKNLKQTNKQTKLPLSLFYIPLLKYFIRFNFGSWLLRYVFKTEIQSCYIGNSLKSNQCLNQNAVHFQVKNHIKTESVKFVCLLCTTNNIKIMLRIVCFRHTFTFSNLIDLNEPLFFESCFLSTWFELYVYMSLILNGSQLAKLEKSIPHMSVP